MIDKDLRIEVGAEVCLVEDGINSSRHKAPDGYPNRRQGVISKIGRKYFYVSADYLEVKFHKDTLQEVTGGYCQDYFLYSSFDVYKLERDTAQCRDKLISDFFNRSSNLAELTIDQCDRIRAIVEEGEDEH